MKRLQGIEISDQDWCPSLFRDAETHFLQISIDKGNYYRPIMGRLKDALIRSRSGRVVDLCSGSGGPWVSMHKKIQESRDIEILLTDLRPNLSARIAQSGNGIRYRSEPLDAGNIPENLSGFRTLFSSFHHFPPEQAGAILKDAVKSNQGIGVFEITERKWSVILRVLVTTPFLVLFIVPFFRPFRFGYFFWTYIIPVIPLMIAFDGIISCFRAYTVEELRSMTNEFNSNYQWQIGIENPYDRYGPFKITYCIGIPSGSADHPVLTDRSR